MEQIEIWKDIEGFEGKYQISNLGRVKSFAKAKEKILTPTHSTDGYLRVTLCGYGKNNIKYYIHRLVAKAFIDNPNMLNEVNHKDENKENNNVDNLEWCTHEYNLTYGALQEKSINSRLANPDLSNTILMFDINGNLIKRFNNQRQIERELGYNHSVISACCSGRFNSSHGYIWIYEKDLSTLPERINKCKQNKQTLIAMSYSNHKRVRKSSNGC